MCDHPGHFIFRRPTYLGGFDYSGIARQLISAIIDIASKKVPSDLPYSNKQLDQLIQKIKFSAIPKNIIQDDVYQEETIQEVEGAEPIVHRQLVQEKNTKEKAIVRLRIPKKKIEEEYVSVDEATGQETKRKQERMVEIDIDDKVLVFPALVSQRDYTIYSLNQSAPRAYRREIYATIRKHFGDYFEGRDQHADQEKFNKLTEDIYDAIEKRFIDDNQDEEKMPVFDFEINLNDGE